MGKDWRWSCDTFCGKHPWLDNVVCDLEHKWMNLLLQEIGQFFPWIRQIRVEAHRVRKDCGFDGGCASPMMEF